MWSERWLLRLHPDECKWMTVNRVADGNQREYHMTKANADGTTTQHALEKVRREKDLGATIDDRLTFEHHIQEKTKKANQIMGLIRRSFIHMDADNFKRFFKAQVRPHVAYAQAVWSPMRKKGIENVQRRATKLVPGLKERSYEDRLRRLDMPTLSYRRHWGDLIELSKMLNEKYYAESCPILTRNESITRSNT